MGSSVAVFAVACVASYLLRSDFHGLPGVQDGIRRLGFPVVIWEEGGFAYRQTFNVVALVIDSALAVVAGLLISVLYSRATHEPTA
jgi:hypothetical protein